LGQHTSKAFDDELEQIGIVIDRMGGIAAGMIEEAAAALERRDARAAERVIAEDPDLDRLQSNLEHLATRMIALRQPVACDLRAVVGAMRIAGDVERIGDLAASIAKRSIRLGAMPGPDPVLAGTRRIATVAASMLRRVIAAHRTSDAVTARAVWAGDAELDEECAALFRTLLTFLLQEPRTIGFGIDAAFCIKNVERIGDHATNIAETVIYIVTGETVEDKRPKGPSL
jgi:phosphate transport system protein